MTDGAHARRGEHSTLVPSPQPLPSLPAFSAERAGPCEWRGIQAFPLKSPNQGYPFRRPLRGVSPPALPVFPVATNPRVNSTILLYFPKQKLAPSTHSSDSPSARLDVRNRRPSRGSAETNPKGHDLLWKVGSTFVSAPAVNETDSD